MIPAIAEFEDGKPAKWVGCGTGESLPRLDLFVKPADGKGGQGVKRLVYEEPDRHCTDDTIALTRAQVLNLISEYSRERPYILQERMFNHQAISSLSVGALCTIRVVTYRAPDGGTGVLTAVFKMATGTCINDNFATGGIGAPVEPDSGILGRAIAKYLPAERVERHPETGHKVVGTRLPHWHEVTRLCMRAHEAFSALPFVGWDVAVTEKGPVLVEGNIEWGAESMQRAHDRPLGHVTVSRNLPCSRAPTKAIQFSYSPGILRPRPGYYLSRARILLPRESAI